MKLKNPMLVVTDIDRSVEFYKKVFGLHIIMDFGANKTLTGGLALQTAETYKEFIGTSDISFGGNNFELYFEEDDFDKFADKLKEYDIEYVHPIMEHSWGQRVVRFYDPDNPCHYDVDSEHYQCGYELRPERNPDYAGKQLFHSGLYGYGLVYDPGVAGHLYGTAESNGTLQ